MTFKVIVVKHQFQVTSPSAGNWTSELFDTEAQAQVKADQLNADYERTLTLL